MLSMILSSIYFLLPAGFANMAPVMGKKILKFLAKPIDHNKTWNGKPIFGKNKTWRGIILGTLLGGAVFYMQQLIYPYSFFQKISIINYQETTILLGFVLGFGALLGDLIESFFKRQYGKKSGQRWVPFDQIDYSIGALLLGSTIYFPGWKQSLYIIVIYFILHIIINHCAYYTNIRKEKW